MRALAVLFAVLLVGCGDDATTTTMPAPPDMAPRPPPDLAGVVETFAPSKTPIGAALCAAAGGPSTDDFARLAQLHVGLVRRDFAWSRLEPLPSQFAWDPMDSSLAAATAQGVSTLGILDYNNRWADPGGDEFAQPDPAKFAGYVGAAVAHFRGKVAAWEIWNEENIGFRFWHPHEDAWAYGDTLVAAYAAAKTADPSTPVLFGGLNWHAEIGEPATDFLDEAYAHRPDLGRSYDVMAVHPYPRYPPAAPPELTDDKEVALPLMIARLRAQLAYYGDGAKPIWVTEYGWPVYGVVDEAAQARDVVRGAVLSLAAGADRACFYTVDDGPNPTSFPPEDAFGVFRNDGTPKPAAAAITALATLDPTAILVEDRSTPGLRFYRAAGASAHFSIAWSTDGMDHVAALGAAGARVLDETGAPIAGADPTRATVPASGDVVYAVEK